MKKFLFMLFATLSLSTFACPLEEEVQNHYVHIYVVQYGYSEAEARTVISRVNNTRISLVTAGMDMDDVDEISTRIMTTGDPLTTTANDALTNGLTTAQQNATDQGFGSLSVTSVTASGNGLDISMSATNGTATTTAQVNTSTNVPIYSSTGATVVGSSSNASSVSNSLYNTNESNRPVLSSSSTTDIATGKIVRIIGGIRVASNGDGGSILLDGTIRGN